MLKIFLTGDNHIGLTYERYHNIKEKLKQSRLDALERMIAYANEEGCDLFVVAGDLFHRFSGISKKLLQQVTEILDKFEGIVLVLPGNHDYYTPEIRLWMDFEDSIQDKIHIHVLNHFHKYEFESAEGEKICVYPAMCQMKHSDTNNLGWIKEEKINPEYYNIGIAHGAIQGITPDLKNEYFQMQEKELKKIPMDAWLIGHTHISYPPNLPCDEFAENFTIFNAGTHEQTDLSCQTEGNGFFLCIDEKKKVRVKRFVSGKIRYYDKKIKLDAEPGKTGLLEEKIRKALEKVDSENAIVRLRLQGSVSPEDYAVREEIYDAVRSELLSLEIQDSELSEQISEEKIKDEFAELSFPAKFLMELTDNATELQMAYDLIREMR